ncbi:hypothetical protein ACFL1B_02725 [Nanoarchaeota archaeon]
MVSRVDSFSGGSEATLVEQAEPLEVVEEPETLELSLEEGPLADYRSILDSLRHNVLVPYLHRGDVRDGTLSKLQADTNIRVSGLMAEKSNPADVQTPERMVRAYQRLNRVLMGLSYFSGEIPRTVLEKVFRMTYCCDWNSEEIFRDNPDNNPCRRDQDGLTGALEEYRHGPNINAELLSKMKELTLICSSCPFRPEGYEASFATPALIIARSSR